MRLKLLLDTQTAQALTQAAVRERRPIDMEAEVLLRRALGLECCDCSCHQQQAEAQWDLEEESCGK